MVFTTVIQNTTEDTSVKTVLIWCLIILLGIVLVVMISKLINNFRGDNQMFYSEKGAINLRIDKLPDIRVATKNCKDFSLTVYKNVMIISYANPFGGVKSFQCTLVGEPIQDGFIMKFTEQDFKKLCYHLKPGNIAIHKNRIVFNYNLSVKAKFYYLKKEV